MNLFLIISLDFVFYAYTELKKKSILEMLLHTESPMHHSDKKGDILQPRQNIFIGNDWSFQSSLVIQRICLHGFLLLAICSVIICLVNFSVWYLTTRLCADSLLC